MLCLANSFRGSRLLGAQDSWTSGIPRNKHVQIPGKMGTAVATSHAVS